MYKIYVCSHIDLKSRVGLAHFAITDNEEAYTKDMSVATSEATPHTMIVALVSFEPVPPPAAPSGIFYVDFAVGRLCQTTERQTRV